MVSEPDSEEEHGFPFSGGPVTGGPGSRRFKTGGFLLGIMGGGEIASRSLCREMAALRLLKKQLVRSHYLFVYGRMGPAQIFEVFGKAPFVDF